ncbi:hypothetical protein NIES4101_44140 [Calothrix sp. NIES-4101]|nr:hypothetical protein NIES4101_44140 [Calothrix sp. NIES-4101]
MSKIYQEIWNSDKNGFSASLRSGEDWHNQNADILLDVQVESSGKRGVDLASNPLFYRVNEDKLRGQTYTTFIKLLDNYISRLNIEEIVTVEEQEEIQLFLDAIMPTAPIQLAREYINQELGENFSEQQFRTKLQRLWFELYSNFYQGKATNFCSGFEHVFVGEAKLPSNFRETRDATPALGEISGYHSWVKFYFDEKYRQVNFLGYKYDLDGNVVPQTPNVITLQMTQNITNIHGEVIAQLFKKMGGFFVGSSPECEIAIATVAFFESVHGKMIKDKKRTTINGAIYDLVMYRNITPTGSRGDLIRSFFPIFLGNEGNEVPPSNDTGRPDRVVVPITFKNDGPVVIARALPNPDGEDDGEEWVELRNITNAAISLTNWEMRDKNNRPEPLSGSLLANQVKRFAITRSKPDSMQLANSPGIISLYNQEGLIMAAVKYTRAQSGEVIDFI